jgi:hypothetical protein
MENTHEHFQRVCAIEIVVKLFTTISMVCALVIIISTFPWGDSFLITEISTVAST